jgi:hypothetical protein
MTAEVLTLSWGRRCVPSGVRVWVVLSVLDGGHGRFTQRALLHRTPRTRRVNGRCGPGGGE